MLTTIGRGLIVLFAVYATHFEITFFGRLCVGFILCTYLVMIFGRWNEEYDEE